MQRDITAIRISPYLFELPVPSCVKLLLVPGCSACVTQLPVPSCVNWLPVVLEDRARVKPAPAVEDGASRCRTELGYRAQRNGIVGFFGSLASPKIPECTFLGVSSSEFQ